MATGIRFTRIVSQTNHILMQFQELQFARFHPPESAWRPNVNVYGFADRIEVCVEMTGVPKEGIEIQVEPRRLVIRGHRDSPEVRCEMPPCGRLLLMEIADGPFERVIEFEMDLDADRTQARWEHGWLWIAVPLVRPAC
jgi:HSP20 family molecular chaperone IbpA